jgi:phosphate transport system protein
MSDSRRTFHLELDLIRDDLLRMAAAVLEAIQRGTDMLLAHDLGAVDAILAADAELDVLSVQVEDRCFHQLALQQPMATDLRRLVTAIRLTAELERSGDLVVNIAKGVRRMVGPIGDPATRGLIQAMSDECVRLFEAALQAYADSDAEKGLALRSMDDALDDLHRAYIERVLDACRHGDLDIQVAVQLALIGRYYERIGDHAVNMGEKVCFLVTGEQAPPPGSAPA